MADYDPLIYEGFFFMGKHLAAGVPMVVIPYGSDQPVNGQRVEKLGVGRVLNMRSITRKKLKDMVLSTFADDAMKKRAKDVLDMIVRAPGNKGGALAVMAYYDKFQKS